MSSSHFSAPLFQSIPSTCTTRSSLASLPLFLTKRSSSFPSPSHYQFAGSPPSALHCFSSQLSFNPSSFQEFLQVSRATLLSLVPLSFLNFGTGSVIVELPPALHDRRSPSPFTPLHQRRHQSYPRKDSGSPPSRDRRLELHPNHSPTLSPSSPRLFLDRNRSLTKDSPGSTGTRLGSRDSPSPKRNSEARRR